MTTFESLINQASEAGIAARREASRRRARPRRTTAKTVVRDIMQAEPDIDRAALIRKALPLLDFDSPGVDAMSDDELMRLVVISNRVLAVQRVLAKAEG